MLKRIPFITPMAPTMAKVPRDGADWIHEVKFDGWRAQVHVEDGVGIVYTRNGSDITQRFRALAPTIDSIPAKSAIIDCELVACDEAGLPCFRTLMDLGNKAPLCLWCFDLLYLNGVGLMPMPLEQRKAMLADLLAAADDQHLQFSGHFDDPERLLGTCENMNLEGIVSKRRSSAYHSGPTKQWLKIKTATWRAANRDRHELFDKARARSSS